MVSMWVWVWVWAGQSGKKVHLKADRSIVVGVKCLKQEVSIHTRIWKKEMKLNLFEYDDEISPSNREIDVCLNIHFGPAFLSIHRVEVEIWRSIHEFLNSFSSFTDLRRTLYKPKTFLIISEHILG